MNLQLSFLAEKYSNLENKITKIQIVMLVLFSFATLLSTFIKLIIQKKSSNMFIQRELLTNFFAPLIWACVKKINEINQNENYKYEEEKIKGRLIDSLNKTLRYWEEEQTKMISKKAKQLCDEFNLMNNKAFDITKFKYKDRDKLGGKKNDWNIRFDHTTPVNILIKKLINCNEENKVIELLNKTSKICIITKEENKALDNAGFKDSRDNGWEVCYKKCGIEICIE
jgi:hypothetical protein